MGRDETAAGLPNQWKMASRPAVRCSKEMQKWKLIDIFLHGDNDFSICITCMSQGLDPSSLKSLKSPVLAESNNLFAFIAVL